MVKDTPANEVAGSGGQGVAVVGADPNGPAAERGVKTGDVILDVGGKAVTNAADVRKALTDAQAAGKHSGRGHALHCAASKVL